MTGFYHLSVSIIGRGQGRSAVACAAYRSGMLLHDERYGRTHDYAQRSGILACGVIAPGNAPGWAEDREQLWNALESFERRKDAQLAREFTLGLPHQLDEAKRREVLEEFVRQELTPHGLIADWAIHAPSRKGDQRNHHAHIMAAIRAVDAEGFIEKKDRSMNSPEQLARWRQAWAEILNRCFEREQIRSSSGNILRADHRSFEDRNLDLEPTEHMGVHATAMERKGMQTDVGDRNRRVRADNGMRIARREARRERQELERKILEARINLAREERERDDYSP